MNVQERIEKLERELAELKALTQPVKWSPKGGDWYKEHSPYGTSYA